MSSVRWPSVGGSTTVVGVVDCEERALGIPLSRGFRACRFGLSAYHDTGRVRRCQVGIFRSSHFSPRHSRNAPPPVIPAPHPRHSRVGGNLDSPPTNHSANAPSDLAGAGCPHEYVVGRRTGGNGGTQGRKEKGIPAYAGMTGWVREWRDGGMGERKDARAQ